MRPLILMKVVGREAPVIINFNAVAYFYPQQGEPDKTVIVFMQGPSEIVECKVRQLREEFSNAIYFKECRRAADGRMEKINAYVNRDAVSKLEVGTELLRGSVLIFKGDKNENMIYVPGTVKEVKARLVAGVGRE
jgi:hypothetical protein